ncbi:hypothetical protein M0R45_034634 [Rubus argutus]|uniref:Phytocyanin domain-containing protein n=1 Tax=Rubus argutus TaxID=59490 RepID=A0AAW1VRK0_RUBAR
MARNTSALAVIALFVVVFPSMVLATQYIVGDDQGWDSGVDYYSWMNGKTFHVGDSLVFNYDPSLHNVVVAANSDVYENCGTSPNFGIWDSGNDVFTLPTKGTYYFLCQYHCDYSDQSIAVVVKH